MPLVKMKSIGVEWALDPVGPMSLQEEKRRRDKKNKRRQRQRLD